MGTGEPTKTNRNEEVRRLNKDGVSYNDLAKKYDISVQRVHQIIKRYSTYKYRRKGVVEACLFCGTQNNLHRHHKNGNTHRHHRSNLVFMCEPCHKKFHKLAKSLYFQPQTSY